MRQLALLLLLPCPALAAWPDDVMVSAMGTRDGGPVDPVVATAGYEQIVRSLGVAIANKPLSPARTLGSAGFDLSFGVTVVGLPTGDNDDGTPSGWTLAHGAGDPAAVAVLPTMTARKGLPSSFEVGASAAWLGASRQGVLSGFVRVAPVEGYEPWPDISFQVGYAGYVGNPELELGTLDASGTIGASVPFGSFPGVKQALISPYIGGGVLVVHSRTVLGDADAGRIFGFDPSDPDADDPTRLSLAPIGQVQGGLQVTNSTVLFRLAGTWSPGVAPSAHVGMGFMF